MVLYSTVTEQFKVAIYGWSWSLSQNKGHFKVKPWLLGHAISIPNGSLRNSAKKAFAPTSGREYFTIKP